MTVTISKQKQKYCRRKRGWERQFCSQATNKTADHKIIIICRCVANNVFCTSMRRVGGGLAQRLNKRMRSKISPCISSCRVFRGVSTREILKTKKVGEAISGHFAMRLKSQIYLYLQMFQKSPFIPCF